MGLTEQQITDAALVKQAMIDGEQTTLRSAEEIIKLDSFITQKSIACNADAKQRVFTSIFNTRLKSKNFPSS